MHCKNCGTENKDNALYCAQCGKVVSWRKILTQPLLNDTHTGTWWDNKVYRLLVGIVIAAVLVLLKERLKLVIKNAF